MSNPVAVATRIGATVTAASVPVVAVFRLSAAWYPFASLTLSPPTVRATILEAGHGIVRTSVILVAEFIVLVPGDYVPIETLGVMLPVTLISAVVLDLTLVSALPQRGWLQAR